MPHVRRKLDLSGREKRAQPGMVAGTVSAFIGSLASGVLAEALRNAWRRVRQLAPGGSTVRHPSQFAQRALPVLLKLFSSLPLPVIHSIGRAGGRLLYALPGGYRRHG